MLEVVVMTGNASTNGVHHLDIGGRSRIGWWLRQFAYQSARSASVS